MSLSRPGAVGVELRFGFTVRELDRLAVVAVTQHKWHQWVPFEERTEIAWSAIAEHLYAADEPPTDSEFFQAAWRAIRVHAEAAWKTHGVSKHDPLAGDHTMPRFLQFWAPVPDGTPEEVVVDRVALVQIWATLPAAHMKLFEAYAVHENYEDAAASLGLKRTTFVTYISLARREFLARWHEGETPSRIWGVSSRRPSTASATTNLVRRRTKRGRS